VLERFGLDHEQAEALTRVTAERASAWYERWAAMLDAPEASEALVDRPTHPDALHRGLELWRHRNGIADE